MSERRAALVRRGLSAAVALGCLTIGVPVVLVVMGGGLIPHGLPSWSQVVTSVTQTGIPDAVLLQALAVICWLLWLDLAVAVCAEVVAVVRGRPVRLPVFVSPLQPVVAQLIAATLLAAAAISARPSTAPASGLRAAMAVATATSSPAPINVVSVPPLSKSASTGGDDDYLVRRGDTLWRIAQRKLGDALRWPSIFELNRGHTQPDRRVLLDPHWIYPGWVFDMPARLAESTSDAASANGNNGFSRPSAPASVGPVVVPLCEPPAPSAIPPSPSPAPSVRPSPPAARPPHAAPGNPPKVVLPTGDVVGFGLAIATVAALAVARLRGGRREGVPRGERPAYLALATPAVRRLLAARWRSRGRADEDETPAVEPTVLTPDRDQPGVVAIGEVEGQELAIEIGELVGTGFDGDGAAGVVRHLVVAFLQHAAPDRAEVILIGDFATLAPSAIEVPAVKGIPDWGTAMGHLEVELLGRTRTLDEHEVPNFTALVGRHPAEPMTALLVVAMDGPDAALRRHLRSLIADVRRLGIGVVFLGPSPVGDTVTVTSAGLVQSVSGGRLAQARTTRLYTLAPSAATELLTLIAASRGASVPATPHAYEPLPVTTAPPRAQPMSVSKRVHVSLFAALPVVRVDGEPLDEVLRRVTPADAPQKDREGLRRKGREILAFLALHSGGATIETLLAALFPDDDPATAIVRLRRDIYNVRDVLRRATTIPDAMFVAFGSERYQLNADLVETDVWVLEQAFNSLGRDSPGEGRVSALNQILSAYSGLLLEHAPYEWIDIGLRENYVRRVVDAAVKLSDTLEQSGDVEGALRAAERALAADRDAEPLYRRVMTLQMTLGHPDSAKRTLRELEARLSEIDAEPTEETARLLRQ